jgi:hypothetical protein
MTDHEKIIQRVQKLLALGQSDNQHESELAITRANELMTKHQLAMSDVEVNELKASAIIREAYTVPGQKMKLLWIETLAYGVARMFDGVTLVNSSLHGTRFAFVGFPEDVELMKAMFEHLYSNWHLIVARDLFHAKEHHKEKSWTPWAPRDTMKFKQGHGQAYAIVIYNRCIEAVNIRNTEVRTTTTGTALVVAKDAALTAYGEAAGWVTSKKRKQTRGSNAGMLAGRAAGYAARINPEISN